MAFIIIIQAINLYPAFLRNTLHRLLKGANQELLPLLSGEKPEQLIAELSPVIFDENLFPRKVEQREGKDMVAESASNFYEGVNTEGGGRILCRKDRAKRSPSCISWIEFKSCEIKWKSN